jgi:anion-transporting  ArsA/GET3 family ATPase
MPRNPLDLKFVVVVGKGGVGKSTVAASLALAHAAAGKRVLLAMCNAKERLSYMLGVEPIGHEIVQVAERVHAVNMEPGAALEEYGLMILKVRALYKLVFENRFVSAFLRGTPGMEAWAMLGKAQFHAFETRPDGSPRYDTVIVDAPATGHGLDLLRVPKVIVDVAPPGLLRREAEKAWKLFSDPRQSGVLLVTLPEELPTNETLELYRTLRGELGLPVCGVAMNMVHERLFDDATRAEVRTLQRELMAADPSSLLAPIVDKSAARAEREADEWQHRERLMTEMPVPYLELPLLMGRDIKRLELEQLSKVVGQALVALMRPSDAPPPR